MSETDGLPLFAQTEPAAASMLANVRAAVRPPTLDAAIHRERREEAIARVDAHADDRWKAEALDAVKTTAMVHDFFTTDEVWATLDRRGVERPPTPSALGPIMRQAASQGIIENTGRIRESRQITNHRKVTIWRSL